MKLKKKKNLKIQNKELLENYINYFYQIIDKLNSGGGYSLRQCFVEWKGY